MNDDHKYYRPVEEFAFNGKPLKLILEQHALWVATGGKEGVRAELLNADLKGANLWGVELHGANLWGAVFRDSNLWKADLSDADLTEADIRNAFLENANFENANVAQIRYNRRSRYRGIRLATCYGSPLFRRFAQDQDFIEEFRDAWWRVPIYLIWLLLADCGRSIGVWGFWSVAAAIIFALKYYSLGSAAFIVNHLPWSQATMLYYSIVTFTTLGFGDVTPKTAEAAWWVMSEVVIGYVMLGGLVSILATKLARRS